MKKLSLNNKIIQNKVFIIAEVGINHNGSFKKCVRMIKAAAKCGVDAIKIQTINESPTIGAEGYKIVFIHPKFTGGVLVELAEKPI